ncbi:MAG TPA: leucyl aminopeptidase [Bryobacteraceae bacterium]|nr:leucyl aminopeptidase [Bryobacteraceae bacterium]
MELKFETKPIEQVESDAIIAIAFDKESAASGLTPEVTMAANAATGGWIEELYESGEFAGKLFEMSLLHRPAGLVAKRLLVVGGGKAAKFTGAELRNATGAAVRFLQSKGARSATLALDAGPSLDTLATAAAEGAILGAYEPDQYKTDDKDSHALETFSVVAPGATEGMNDVLDRALIIAEAQNFARALASEPANRMTPTILAQRARDMCFGSALQCEVMDQSAMRQLGMGALLGVAQGSAEPPALIILRYHPFEEADGAAHLGLVGKGVTFDSGGISIKPSENMDKMKYDMCGGAAVLGAMQAIARLAPPIRVTALIPAVENMPGSRAQRPGDIVTTLSGKTVEVLNTDAEGRLILADALTYAQQQGCTHLVDAATLTGAIVVALGHLHTGAFGNDDALLDQTLAAARAEGEKLWPMPLDEEYKEQLKSPFADLPNIGTRWGGAITAAMFLKQFADPLPWVHLDIAGTAWLEETKPYMPKGPTGVGVRTLVRLAVGWGS